MRVLFSVHLFAEIFVVRDDYPLLAVSFSQDLGVRYPSRLIVHRKYLVSLLSKPTGHFGADALIDKKSHYAGSATRGMKSVS